MVGNYMPKGIVGGILFMGVMLFVWPVQDFRDRWGL
jgi:hypothetical protein